MIQFGVCFILYFLKFSNIPGFWKDMLFTISNWHVLQKYIFTTGYVIVFYHSTSQSSDKFENFLSSFDQIITDMNLNNQAFRLILWDFNCRLRSWASLGYHRTNTYSSSVLYLHQTNLYWPATLQINGSIHSCLHPNCYHLITHYMINLRIVSPFVWAPSLKLQELLYWNHSKTKQTKKKTEISSIR